MQTKDIIQILQPQTDLERKLLTTTEFQEGMSWGVPRFGHPEGAVVYHVREVLENIAAIKGISDAMRTKLRIIAFAHDTFKYYEQKFKPRKKETHHSVLARRFMEQYIEDSDVLSVIELHDEAYYCWRKEKLPRFAHIGEFNLPSLLKEIEPYLQLYYLFFKCDTQTGDKNQAPLHWFEKNVSGITVMPIRELRLA